MDYAIWNISYYIKVKSVPSTCQVGLITACDPIEKVGEERNKKSIDICNGTVEPLYNEHHWEPTFCPF